MATIVTPPPEKFVKCNTCGATISYLPEDVRERTYTVMGESSGDRVVKCPRENCTGVGVLSSW